MYVEIVARRRLALWLICSSLALLAGPAARADTGHLDMLYFNTSAGTWTNQDISNAAGGESALSPGIGQALFGTTGSELVYFLDPTSQHVRQYLHNTSVCGATGWCDLDVTAASNNPTVLGAIGTQFGSISIISGSNTAMQLFYEGGNAHLYELSCASVGANGSCSVAWGNQDLTGLTGNGEMVAGGGLAIQTISGASVGTYAFFIDTQRHVRQYNNSSACPSWCDTDLTAASTAPTALAASGSRIFRGLDASGGLIVLYIGADQHLAMLYCVPSGANNLCTSSVPGTWDNVQGFSTEQANPAAIRFIRDTMQSWIFFVDVSLHVRGYQYLSGATASAGSWQDNDLTASTGGPLVTSGTELGILDPANAPHLSYVAQDDSVHHLTLAGTWSDQNLSVLSHANTTALATTDLNSIILADGYHIVYIQQQPQASSDGPLPLWALIVLGAGVLGVARRRLRMSA
jgi:hypothetical protein